jgi:hypothetical protein
MPIWTGASVVAAKVETTSGTFIQPTGDDVLIVENVEFTPLDVKTVAFKPMVPYFDGGDEYTAGELTRIAFDVAMIGNGGLSTMPRWSDLLKCCGMLYLAKSNVHTATQFGCDATGKIATATSVNHGFKEGQFVVISGVGVAYYNAPSGTYIRNVKANTFDYTVTGGSPSNVYTPINPGNVNISADNQWLLRTRKYDGPTTLSLSFCLDSIRHDFAGVAGTFILKGTSADALRLRFDLVGITPKTNFVTVDSALSGADFSQYLLRRPELLRDVNTSGEVLGAVASPRFYEFSLAQGNTIDHDDPMTGAESLDITNRQSSGSLTIATPDMTDTPDTTNYAELVDDIRNKVWVPFALSNGTSLGNKVSIRADNLQLLDYKLADRGGRSVMQIGVKPRTKYADQNFHFSLS